MLKTYLPKLYKNVGKLHVNDTAKLTGGELKTN